MSGLRIERREGDVLVDDSDQTEEKSKLFDDEHRSVKVDRVYNIKLIIQTVSGKKHVALLNFADMVRSGKTTKEKAIAMLEHIENDLRDRTFMRPLSYSDAQGPDGTVEYFFNPVNIESIGIVRMFP